MRPRTSIYLFILLLDNRYSFHRAGTSYSLITLRSCLPCKRMARRHWQGSSTTRSSNPTSPLRIFPTEKSSSSVYCSQVELQSYNTTTKVSNFVFSSVASWKSRNLNLYRLHSLIGDKLKLQLRFRLPAYSSAHHLVFWRFSSSALKAFAHQLTNVSSGHR
jgi:hypothetical protein